jgi:hypothetical protein
MTNTLHDIENNEAVELLQKHFGIALETKDWVKKITAISFKNNKLHK